MKRSLILVLALVTYGCTTASSHGTSSGHPSDASSASAAPGALAAPAAKPGCAPGAYRHSVPSFCFLVPPGFETTPRALSPDGIVFDPTPASGEGRSLAISWANVSDRARAEALRTTPHAHLETGLFEILETQQLPQGTFWITHDATQRKDEDIYKIPTVNGVAVIETAAYVLRCEARQTLKHGVDAREAARAQAALLGACKSFVAPASGAPAPPPAGTLRGDATQFPVQAGTSCAGHGASTPARPLTRNGSTWSREESWAGGCPRGPVLSMVYEPHTSPLEVRICVDQEQDRCQAIRGGLVTWDLSTPLAEAGANDIVLMP